MGEAAKNICETHIIHPDCRERLLPLEHPAAAALKASDLSLAGLSDLRTAYRIGRVAPRYHVVLGTLSGSGVLYTTGGSVCLNAGSLVLLPAMTPYLYALTGRRWRLLWFHLRASTSTWRAFQNRGWDWRNAEGLDQIASAAEGFLSETSRLSVGRDGTGAGRTRTAVLYAELLTALLERELHPFLRAGDESAGEDDTPQETALRRRLEEVWSEVDATLQLPWSVEQLARRAHMSPGHFHRVVLRLMGTSPGEYLTRLRMARARALLVSSDLLIYQISTLVGYENPFAFSAAFKRQTGQSPREFRTAAPPG